MNFRNGCMQIWLENEVSRFVSANFPTSDTFSNSHGSSHPKWQDYSTVSPISTYQSVAAQGILLTNYNAITHPSEPNYIAAVAGTNFGIDSDDYYDIPAAQKSVFDLLEAQGLTWKAYNEDIPAPGWTGYIADGGAYVRKHDPAIIFDNIGLNQTRSANVVSGEAVICWVDYSPGSNVDAPQQLSSRVTSPTTTCLRTRSIRRTSPTTDTTLTHRSLGPGSSISWNRQYMMLGFWKRHWCSLRLTRMRARATGTRCGRA